MSTKRSTDLNLLHAGFRAKVQGVIAELARQKVPMVVFEAFRSAARQGELYAQGRTKLFDDNKQKLKVVTKAPPWSSYHQYGFAVDFVLAIPGVNPWANSPHWATLHRIGAQFDLMPLSFEAAHLQPKDVSIAALRAGNFPRAGGVSWAANMRQAIKDWPEGAPPIAQVLEV